MWFVLYKGKPGYYYSGGWEIGIFYEDIASKAMYV